MVESTGRTARYHDNRVCKVDEGQQTHPASRSRNPPHCRGLCLGRTFQPTEFHRSYRRHRRHRAPGDGVLLTPGRQQPKGCYKTVDVTDTDRPPMAHRPDPRRFTASALTTAHLDNPAVSIRITLAFLVRRWLTLNHAATEIVRTHRRSGETHCTTTRSMIWN
jgi:hypothetical protein